MPVIDAMTSPLAGEQLQRRMAMVRGDQALERNGLRGRARLFGIGQRRHAKRRRHHPPQEMRPKITSAKLSPTL